MRAQAGDSLPSSEPAAPQAKPTEPAKLEHTPARTPGTGAMTAGPGAAEPEAIEPDATPRETAGEADRPVSDRQTSRIVEPPVEGPAREAAGVPPARVPEPVTTPEPELHPAHAAAPAPHVVIIGGGAIGGALAHDLVLRGIRVTVLEKGELTSGATGRSQGLLHSGARYATTNRRLAIECAAESKLLRRLAPGTFEENDGLYVAVTDEDAAFAPRFLEACWQAAVPTRELTREQALRAEPGLNPQLRMAVQVPDATMDSMRLPLRFFATARRNGADIRHFAEVVGVRVARGASRGAATGVRVRDRATDGEYEIGADLIVNAAGPWAARVAALAQIRLDTSIVSGVMASMRGRRVHLAISRLHPPADSDTLLPDRGSTIVGPIRSASERFVERGGDTIDSDTVEELRHLAAVLVPALSSAPVRARWVARQAVRRAAGNKLPSVEVDEPVVVDHGRGRAGVEGFVTVTGGPATIARSTAQAAADLICRRLGVDRQCVTADTPLLPHTAWYSR